MSKILPERFFQHGRRDLLCVKTADFLSLPTLGRVICIFGGPASSLNSPTCPNDKRMQLCVYEKVETYLKGSQAPTALGLFMGA